MPDDEVLALSQERPEMFSVLVERYQEAFLRKGRGIFNNSQEAEDAAQETFVKIYTKAHMFRNMEGASFKSWAYKIFLNECFTLYRKLKKDKEALVRLDREIAELIPDRGAIVEQERKLTTDYVLSLISKIPVVFRKAVTLHFVEGLPQKEVADIIGVSENAVRTRIHRAKKGLKSASVLISQ